MWPHRWQLTRLPHPWDFPGKNTEVGCQFLLQCMEVKSESEIAQLCPTLSDPMDCSLLGSSVHGIFQARVLEWGAIAFSVIGSYIPIIALNVSWINATTKSHGITEWIPKQDLYVCCLPETQFRGNDTCRMKVKKIIMQIEIKRKSSNTQIKRTLK